MKRANIIFCSVSIYLERYSHPKEVEGAHPTFQGRGEGKGRPPVTMPPCFTIVGALGILFYWEQMVMTVIYNTEMLVYSLLIYFIIIYLYY